MNMDDFFHNYDRFDVLDYNDAAGQFMIVGSGSENGVISILRGIKPKLGAPYPRIYDRKEDKLYAGPDGRADFIWKFFPNQSR